MLIGVFRADYLVVTLFRTDTTFLSVFYTTSFPATLSRVDLSLGRHHRRPTHRRHELLQLMKNHRGHFHLQDVKLESNPRQSNNNGSVFVSFRGACAYS